MALQEPVRAWPWSITRASMVTPPAAAVERARGPASNATTASRASARWTSPRRTDRERQGRVRHASSWRVAGAARWWRPTVSMSRRPNPTTPRDPQKLRGRPGPVRRFPLVPSISPFRALRYSRELVEDLSKVVAPPYDVIGPEAHRRLLARDPRNVVRLDLPEEQPGDPPDERYRRAARTLSAWRSDGTLRRDVRPALYAYEQTYRVPGTDRIATGAACLPASASSRSARRAASGPTSGRWPSRARIAIGSCARRP